MRMNVPSDCNARIRILQVDCKQAVSLSQQLCTYYNKGSHTLSTVYTWGCMQYFFKSCLAIVTTGFGSVSLTRMHWHTVPQEIKQSYTKNYDALVYNINQGRQFFFPMRLFVKLLDDGLCDSHRWRIYTPPVSTKHFPLKIGVLC